MNINFEEKFDMVEDLWITIQTLKFYKPERGTHEFFHVSDTINWAEGKINLLFESAKNQYKEKIKELEAKEKQYKDQVEELHRDKDRIRQAQLKTFEEINEQLEADGLYQEDDYEDIPEVAAPMEIIEAERIEKIIAEVEKENPIEPIPEDLIIEDVEKTLENTGFKIQKLEKKTRVRIPLAEKNKNIKEGIIKFFQSRGGKSTFKYNFGQGSKPESVEEAKEIWKLCKSIDTKAIRMAFKSLVFSGKIQHKGGGRRNSVYILMEAVKPVCPRCSGSSLVKAVEEREAA